jgi:hypothetical protein
MVPTITETEVDRALDGVAEFFAERETRPGAVARRLLGHPLPDDERLIDHLIRERRRKTRLDGGIGGWVVGTTWSAWELMQLGCPPDHTGVSRMIGYLLARQDLPGRFGEGCSERRHAIGHCKHFLNGFFSPATADEVVSPLTFPSGVIITHEWEARFAASCFALRTVLQARQERRKSVQLHLNGLVDLAARWEQQQFSASPDLLFFVLGAFALTPIEHREHAQRLTNRLVAMQTEQGEWESGSLFHALDNLLHAPFSEARDAVQRATPPLIARQQPNGSFDETDNEELALIALRALRTHGPARLKMRSPRVATSTIPRFRY